MKVLFVDDELAVLEGLENRFRKYRKDWSMDFIQGGPAALALLETKPFDVLVTDIRMPEVDGLQLLQFARSKRPSMLRVALTGQTEQEQLLKNLAIAHQLVAKPCDAEHLKSVIESAICLQAKISDPSVVETVNRIGHLPALPKVHSELNNLMMNDSFTIEALAKVVEQDLATCSKILQLVNSSIFSIQREITSVFEAINFLGIDTLRSIVLNIEVFEHFEAVNPECVGYLERLQQHSIAIAELSCAIGSASATQKLAKSAALLHGVGKLILKCYLPDNYRAVVDYANKHSVSFYAAEQATQDFSHAVIAAYLLSLWDLPSSLVETVATYCEPEALIDQPISAAMAIHLADALISTSNHGTVDGTPAPTISPAVAAHPAACENLSQWQKLASGR